MALSGTGSAARKADIFDRLAAVGKAFASPKRLELREWRTHGHPVADAS